MIGLLRTRLRLFGELFQERVDGGVEGCLRLVGAGVVGGEGVVLRLLREVRAPVGGDRVRELQRGRVRDLVRVKVEGGRAWKLEDK